MTPTQKSNLARLALYLRTQKPSKAFDMSDYARDYDSDEGCDLEPCEVVERKKEHPCGTSCCAAGHGPLIGIRPLVCERWMDYVFRVFGKSQRAWSWMFGPEWVPDKEQAARRIALVASGQPIFPDWLVGDPYVVPDVIDWNKLNDFAKNEPT